MSKQMSANAIKACFENQTHQADVLVAIYRLVFPAWDDIDQLDGWPSVNDKTWKAIARMFMDFDTLHHPNVLAGGLWMNCGFTTAHGVMLRDWEVSVQGIKVRWKKLPKTA